MNRFRHWVAALATAGLLVSGCGGSEESSVTTIGVLSAALADTAEASTFRETLYTGITMKLPSVGYESTFDIDEERPLLVGEVSPEREHLVVDVGVFLEALLGDFAGVDDFGFEMWIDDELVVMDTSSYGKLVNDAPEIDLGPLAPGVFSIDLVALGADSPELLEALVGSSTPDLSELALSLPAALREIEQTSTNPQIFVGTAFFADLLEAQGAVLEDEARAAASGIALTQGVSVDALTDFYVDFYQSVEAEVVIELDERGLLRVFSTRADLSGLFSQMFEREGLLPPTTEQQRQEARESFKDAEMILETRAVYEAGIDLEVSQVPEATEDRTEEWREFLINSGFGG